MNFEIYCDESGLEALSNKVAHTYTGIGGIWISADHIFMNRVVKSNKIENYYTILSFPHCD